MQREECTLLPVYLTGIVVLIALGCLHIIILASQASELDFVPHIPLLRQRVGMVVKFVPAFNISTRNFLQCPPSTAAITVATRITIVLQYNSDHISSVWLLTG